MTPQEIFVKNYYAFAHLVEVRTGMSATAILTQAALESGWGKKVKGNNFFGIKATKSTPATDKQLFTTTEFLATDKAIFPVVIRISKHSNTLWKYVVQDWFRKYETPLDSFLDHASFFKRLPRYSKAWQVRQDPENFFREIHKAGYATAPNYAEVLIKLHKQIETIVEKEITNKLK